MSGLPPAPLDRGPTAAAQTPVAGAPPPRAAVVAAAIVALGAPVGLLIVLWRLGVDVPHWDEWVHGMFLAGVADGQTTARDWFVQYNESRVAVGRLTMFAFAVSTGWNLRIQSLAAPALAFVTLLLLAKVGASSSRTRTGSSWAGVAITSVLLFSPTQDDNWMMSLQHIAFIPGVCLAGIFVLASSPHAWWARWGIASVLAVIASFSVPNGLLLWVLAPPALWWPRDPRLDGMRGVGLAVWTLAASTTVWFFLRGYVRVSEHPALVTPFSDAPRFALYMATFLGGPFSRGTAFPALTVAPVVGSLLLSACLGAAFLVVRRPDTRRASVPWLLLGAYALAHGAAGAGLRSAAGLVQALPSRYATYALALPIALTWLLHLWFGARQPPRPLSATTLVSGTGAVAALLTLLTLSSIQAVAEMAALSRALTTARAALGFVGQVSDTKPLEVLFPRMDLLPEYAGVLWRHGWLRPPRRDTDKVPAEGDVGAATGAGRLEQGRVADGLVTLEGWAMIPTRKAPADLVAIAWHDAHDVGRVFAFAGMQPDRPKGYFAAQGDSRRHAGWAVVLEAAAIPVGATRLSAWALDGQSGRAFELSGTYSVDAPTP